MKPKKDILMEKMKIWNMIWCRFLAVPSASADTDKHAATERLSPLGFVLSDFSSVVEIPSFLGSISLDSFSLLVKFQQGVLHCNLALHHQISMQFIIHEEKDEGGRRKEKEEEEKTGTILSFPVYGV
ncbi:hypothetical protein VNO77_30102 [Canavalia gladiata]|uniref:Uncharacterized protein n=1 Tax=Canavalia gladiata TaxID=3824 RepID=A0AAN9Q182_CANGL